jgi:hypothetical protein
MELFSKYENNTAVNHPVTLDNLKMVYPNIDFSSELPDGWKRFIRILPENKENFRYEHNGYVYNTEHDYFYDDWIEVELQHDPVIFEDANIDTYGDT